MGIYSTMDITRADAIRAIDEAISDTGTDRRAVREALLDMDATDVYVRGAAALSDPELEDLLFRLVGDRWLNNFMIVREYRDNGDLSYRPHREPLGTRDDDEPDGDAVARAKAAMDAMTDGERFEVIRMYCMNCGSRDPACQCENDE